MRKSSPFLLRKEPKHPLALILVKGEWIRPWSILSTEPIIRLERVMRMRARVFVGCSPVFSMNCSDKTYRPSGRPPFPPPLPHLTEPWRIFSTHVKRKPRKASANLSVGGNHCQFGKSDANEGPFVRRVVTMNCSGKIY